MRHFVAHLFCAALFASASVAADLNAVIQQAVDTYQSALDTTDRSRRVQTFARAESLFASVIAKQREENSPDIVSADLYFNLGNAALGAEHRGESILAFRRALATDPGHRAASQNLEHARTLLPDWIPTPDESVSLGSTLQWTRTMKSADWYGFAAIAFLMAMLLLAVYLRTAKPVARNLAILFGLIWLAALSRPLLSANSQTQQIAVVVVPEVTARSADSINAPAKFSQPLPSGAELQIVDDRDDWIRVRLFDGREAWLPASAVESVTP